MELLRESNEVLQQEGPYFLIGNYFYVIICSYFFQNNPKNPEFFCSLKYDVYLKGSRGDSWLKARVSNLHAKKKVTGLLRGTVANEPVRSTRNSFM